MFLQIQVSAEIVIDVAEHVSGFPAMEALINEGSNKLGDISLLPKFRTLSFTHSQESVFRLFT